MSPSLVEVVRDDVLKTQDGQMELWVVSGVAAVASG